MTIGDLIGGIVAAVIRQWAGIPNATVPSWSYIDA